MLVLLLVGVAVFGLAGAGEPVSGAGENSVSNQMDLVMPGARYSTVSGVL